MIEVKLYTIECHQGAPLSSWSEPETLENILDRYYDQFIEHADDIEDLKLERKDFTAELFQDIWECSLVEVV